MNILNIILLSCSVAVTIAQKVDTSNDIIDGQRRNAGGYGLLRPGLQGGYNPGGYNQAGYNPGGYNQGGYNQGGYNQGGYPNQGGYNQGYGGYNGYNGGYGGATPGGFGQGYGGNQGYGQGYGGNPGYGGSGSGYGSYPGQGGYPGGYPGSTGGYGGVGGYPSGIGQEYPGYPSSGSGNRPGRYPNRPGSIDYTRPIYPEGPFPGRNGLANKYRPFLDRPITTPYNVHTGNYYTAYEDRYKYSDNVRHLLGRKAGEIKEGEEKS